jgi:hypothetical protein
MELYIRIENNQPVEHPALKDNLIQAFGIIPNNWEPFKRVERPALDVYEVLEFDQPTYKKIDGIWSDVWSVRPMTEAEKIVKQQATVELFNQREQAENWASWTLNKETCAMQPPIPRPAPDETKLAKNIYTFWSGADNNWKDTPPRPENIFKFDFFSWKWIEVSE